MLKLVSLSILFFFISFSANGQWQVNQPIRMLALGDSYTIGQSVQPNNRWPEQLLDSLEHRGYLRDTLQIIATTGWRTDQLLNAIEGENLKRKNFNLISLLIGVNNQYQGLPFALYKPELLTLIDSALSYLNNDTSKLIIVSIPDYAFTPFGQQATNPFIISQQLDMYNGIARGVADSLNIFFFNITPISRRALAEPNLVANDGLHPSGQQYSKWVEQIINTVDSTSHLGLIQNETAGFNIIRNGSEIALESNLGEPITEIKVYSLDGRCLYQQQLLKPMQQIRFELNLEKGTIVIFHCHYGKKQSIQKYFPY